MTDDRRFWVIADPRRCDEGVVGRADPRRLDGMGVKLEVREVEDRAVLCLITAAVTPPERFKVWAADEFPSFKLMHAVLMNGLRSLFYRDSKEPQAALRIRREAKEWLMVDQYGDLMSFVSICSLFELDHVVLRRVMNQSLADDQQPVFLEG